MKKSIALGALLLAPAMAAAQEESTPAPPRVEEVEASVEALNESYLETKGIVDALAKLKISGLIQAQYSYYADTNLVSGSTWSQQQGELKVRRGRLKATYDAKNGSAWVMQYNIDETGLKPQDIYLKWEEPWLRTFSLQAGLQDIPFGYEISYSSSAMEWLERSRFERSAMFKDEKDVGVILGANPSIPGLDAAGLKLAILNGTGIAKGVEDPACFVGRLSLGKNFYDAGMGIDLGGSYYRDARTVKTGGVYYDVDGSASPRKTGEIRKELEASLIGADAQLSVDMSFVPFLSGAKLLGELYTGNAIGSSGRNERVITTTDTLFVRNVMGWYASYVQNIGKSIQAVVRYDVYDPNTDVEGDEIGQDKKTKTGAADIAYDTWYFGLNIFLNGNTKLTIGYDLVNNETTKNVKSATVAKNDYAGDIDDNILTVRGQFAF